MVTNRSLLDSVLEIPLRIGIARAIPMRLSHRVSVLMGHALRPLLVMDQHLVIAALVLDGVVRLLRMYFLSPTSPF